MLSPKSRSEFNRKLTITGNGLFSSISVFCDFSCTSWSRTYLPKSTAKYLLRSVLMGFVLALMPYDIFKIVSFMRLICNPHPIVQIEIPSREWTYWMCMYVCTEYRSGSHLISINFCSTIQMKVIERFQSNNKNNSESYARMPLIHTYSSQIWRYTHKKRETQIFCNVNRGIHSVRKFYYIFKLLLCINTQYFRPFFCFHCLTFGIVLIWKWHLKNSNEMICVASST